VRGGHDLFGTELTPLDIEAAVREARAAREAGFEALAVTATGAVGSTDHETAVAERILGDRKSSARHGEPATQCERKPVGSSSCTCDHKVEYERKFVLQLRCFLVHPRQ
jgi:hypothetical protein